MPLGKNPNPFDDGGEKDLHLAMCARAGCSKCEEATENISEKMPSMQNILSGGKLEPMRTVTVSSFPRCPLCMTRYCSRDCQVQDHQKGEHKEKCRKFKVVKEHCEKTLCKSCWEAKWAYLTDFYPSGKRSTRLYVPCKKCLSKELTLEDSLPDDITSDPDIRRIWFQ